MKARLTDALVKKAIPPAKGYSLTWDEETTAFGFRITARGVRSFVVAYTTVGGKERRLTLGQYPALSVTAARRLAVETRGRVYAGQDPMQDRRTRRQDAARAVRPPTLGDLKERYFEEHVHLRRTPEGAKNEAIYWRAILTVLPTALPLSDLRHASVQQLHKALSDKPIRANRVITSLSTALNFAVKRGWIAENVAKGVHRNPENPRERYLTDDEITRLNYALDAHPMRESALAIRFLLLTGARKGETLQALWSDIDLTLGFWTKPAGTTKTRRVHRVVLSDAALDVLREMRSRHPKSQFVFPGASGDALTSFKRTWGSIRRSAGIPGFRLHDLRHSHASLMARAGASLLLIGNALGHTQPSTTLRYTHLTEGALRQTTNQVAEYASGKLNGENCK